MKQPSKTTRKQKKEQHGTVKNFEEFRSRERRRILENDRKRRGRELNRELNGGGNENQEN